MTEGKLRHVGPRLDVLGRLTGLIQGFSVCVGVRVC